MSRAATAFQILTIASLGSTSFIEEEHQTIFFLTSTAFVIIPIAAMRRPKQTAIFGSPIPTVSVFVLLGAFRGAKKLNQGRIQWLYRLLPIRICLRKSVYIVHTGCPICSCTWVGLTLIWVFHHLAKLLSHFCQIPFSPRRIWQTTQPRCTSRWDTLCSAIEQVCFGSKVQRLVESRSRPVHSWPPNGPRKKSPPSRP